MAMILSLIDKYSDLFYDLSTKPKTINLKVEGQSEMLTNTDPGFLHKILEGDVTDAHVGIKGDRHKLYEKEDVKKLLYWLDKNSYSASISFPQIIGKSEELRKCHCAMAVTFRLNVDLFADIPDDADGFTDL